VFVACSTAESGVLCVFLACGLQRKLNIMQLLQDDIASSDAFVGCSNLAELCKVADSARTRDSSFRNTLSVTLRFSTEMQYFVLSRGFSKHHFSVSQFLSLDVIKTIVCM